MRLLLDEMYSPALAMGLRARGHDVVSVHELSSPSLAGASDTEVFAAARAGGRALVTESVSDFRPLEAEIIARAARHSGIVYTSNRQFPRGDPATLGHLVRALEALLRENDGLGDRSVFLRPV